MDSMDEDSKTCPWMSFQTFWNFLEALTANPLPPKIDRSIMSSKSGSDQSNLMAAMQTFGLIDGDGRVQPDLESFRTADADTRKRMLAGWVRTHYQAPLRVSAQNGTPQDLINVFRDELGMTAPVTRRKAITFFQHAAQHAGIALSPNFPKTRTGSGAPGTPKKRTSTRRKTKTNGDEGGQDEQQRPAPKGHSQTIELNSGGTITLTYDVNMFEVTDEDEAFVLSLIKKLRNYPSATADGSTQQLDEGDDS